MSFERILDPQQELEFIPQLHLDRVSVHKHGWNFRCPICGDSKKSKYKKRGWILPSVDKVVYYCHNCFVSITFRNFLKQTHPDVFEKYKQEEKKAPRDSPDPSQRSDNYLYAFDSCTAFSPSC